MDYFLAITNLFDFFNSQEGWWILFGILGLVIGMLPKENIFHLKRVLLILCLGWTLIYLQFRLSGDPLSIFLNYSLPQLLFFGIPYRLADYFIKSELFKAKLKIREDLESQIKKEYQNLYPSISKASFEIIKGISHVALRDKAIEDATKSLIIASGWVSKYVVTRDFISKLQSKINKGVKVRIIYGYKDSKGFHSSDKWSMDLLNEFKKNNKEGDVKIIVKPNHAKILVVDDKYCICGSYNWLSNSRASNKEVSFKSYDKDVIADTKMVIKDIANN